MNQRSNKLICYRCGQEKQQDQIGQLLRSFVCRDCRLDKTEWQFKERLEERDNEETNYLAD